MFKGKQFFTWIAILLLSGMFLMGQETWAPPPNSIESVAVYKAGPYTSEGEYVPAGTIIRVTCTGNINKAGIVGANGAFKIFLDSLTGSCSFNPIEIADANGGTQRYNCYDEVGDENCTFTLTGSHLAFDNVWFDFDCSAVDNCTAWCAYNGDCCDGPYCDTCITNCENNKCS